MATELVHGDASRPHPEPRNVAVPDDQEMIIQFCYELVCSGRPFSEILAETKRLSVLQKESNSDALDRTVYAQVPDHPDEVPRWDDTGVNSRAGRISEPTEGKQVQQSPVLPITCSLLARLLSKPAKILTLALVFTATLISVFTYIELGKAHQNSPDRLLKSAHDRGRELSQSMLPMLKPATIGDLAQLGRQLDQFGGTGATIRLLLTPADGDGENFYYVGSSPMSTLDVVRQTLAAQGVLDRLTEICRARSPFSLTHDQSTFGTEVIAVTPIWTAAGCWAVIATFSAEALGSGKGG